MHDVRILRDRLAAYDDAFDAAQAGGDEDCSAAFLGQTTTVSSYPTSASAMYAVNPVSVVGTEGEGETASYVADTGTVVYAFNIGHTVPPAGTNVVVHSAGGRWVFSYG